MDSDWKPDQKVPGRFRYYSAGNPTAWHATHERMGRYQFWTLRDNDLVVVRVQLPATWHRCGLLSAIDPLMADARRWIEENDS